MKRSDAIAIIEREQSKGRFESELDTAIGIALHALKEPREMCCGGCQRFGDEDVNGVGWCEERVLRVRVVPHGAQRLEL